MDLSYNKCGEWLKLPFYKKIQIYGIYLDERYKIFVDKIESKKYVNEIIKKNKIENLKIPKIVKILKNIFDIDENDINQNHILKASHGSGWLLDFEEYKNINIIKSKLCKWNKIYSTKESQYKYLKPTFFIEEKINCLYKGKTGKANDIKVHCFSGIPKVIMLRENNENIIKNYYDISMNLLNKPEKIIKIPENINEIIEISKTLSELFEYVRMDYYIDENKKIYFSEFTFTDNVGKQKLSDELELYLGNFWQ